MKAYELTSIENGIWLCSHHSEIIDKDPERYSAETLRNWKLNAEAETYCKLNELEKEKAINNETLIALTSELLFYGTWSSSK